MDTKACWYQRNSAASWRGGKWHAWSTDYDDTEPGHQFPVAIVEDEKTGEILTVPVRMVCFVAIPPAGGYPPPKYERDRT